MKWLIYQSIWGASSVNAVDWRFRGILRFVLPVTDLLFMSFGVVGLTKGVKLVTMATNPTWQFWWSMLVLVSATLCLIGVSFPKLWPVELTAKVALISLVVGFISLSIANMEISSGTPLFIILVILPIWRVGDLGFVAWDRQRKGDKWAQER